MIAEQRYTTFLTVFPGPEAEQMAAFMRSGINEKARRPVRVLALPYPSAVLLDPRSPASGDLDSWWAAQNPAITDPVVVMLDEPGLERFLPGLDAHFVVGVQRSAELPRWQGFENAIATVSDHPMQLAEFAMQYHSVRGRDSFRSDVPYRGWWLSDMMKPGADRGRRTASAWAAPPSAADWASSKETPPAKALPDPFQALAELGPQPYLPPEEAPTGPQLSRASLLGTSQPQVGGARRLPTSMPAKPTGVGAALSQLLAGPRWPEIPRDVGDLLLSLSPHAVVAVVSRAGGVGKTAIAAAVAQVAGYALGETTGSAAVVDQNTGNPDQWGRMHIPEGAATVSSLMAALSAGAELPPPPVWARNVPALAVYPEDRQAATAYSPGQIQRFVAYLRERHVLTVVDLPNRLPDLQSTEGLICAAYLELADLVILPTTDDPNRLAGVNEYLAEPALANKPVVVAYIESTERRLRRHPKVIEALNGIRARTTAVVAIPKSEKATLAIVEGRPIVEIAADLRQSYVDLTLTVARALLARQRAGG
ncbi:MAG: hypothetical protein ACR2MZ_04105 [Candidatus Dormibacter sp.]|uniref:hypothetical protein n=1 Tax=Candidatus Dormibacter sp. TaxID=2973982 RepID=UPI000DB7E86A|nr:MAG: hypothetical protein DLM66_06230 [Candidatus Dormibacteraeota bacterium]